MENINLIRKIAWSFYHTTGLDWEDLFQEAAIAYLEAKDNYNPGDGKITTYLWHCMTKRLNNYLKEQESYKCAQHNGGSGIASLEDITTDPYIETTPFWEELSVTAQMIAEVVIASPKPYLEHETRPLSINRIRRVMRNYGWDWNKTREGLNELRTVYSKRTTPWI